MFNGNMAETMDQLKRFRRRAAIVTVSVVAAVIGTIIYFFR